MFLELENQKLKKLYNLKLLVITKSEISSCESCEEWTTWTTHEVKQIRNMKIRILISLIINKI